MRTQIFAGICMLVMLCVACDALAQETEPIGELAADAVVSNAEDESNALLSTLHLAELTLDELLDLRALINEEIDLRGGAAIEAETVYFDLGRGDKGEEVANLQERLLILGYYTGSISGKYDTQTQKAMKAFEKANGLANDGNASREDQALLYSEEALPKEQPQPENFTEVTKTPKVETEDNHTEYGDFDYDAAARYPEQYMGEKVKVIGKVVQVLGSRSKGFQIRLATAGSDDIVYLFVNFDPGYNILENDRLTVYGELRGTVTYTSVLKQSITIPSMIADEVVLR